MPAKFLKRNTRSSPTAAFLRSSINGKEMEVEIEAVTGKLDEEPEEEIYQIGEEK